MASITLRDAGEADFGRIVELNQREVVQTSAMDAGRLALLHGLATHHKVALVDGAVVAFLLAMRDGVDYRNENYQWFAARFPRFVYIDRIVVDAGFSGRGIARRLYEDLFAGARAQGIPVAACEYNLQPPNPASQAFHDRLGFREVGVQHVTGGTKQVTLQVADLAAPRDTPAIAAHRPLT
jgi:predicted GNAT superfamily acetyltransferase